jgi:Protein kinase domain
MLSRVGKYEIIDEVGRGAFGVVYRARDFSLGQTVALKVLSDAQIRNPEGRRTFRQEASAAATLNHPGIVTIIDFLEEDETPVIVYEFVEGRTLDKVIAQRRLSEDEVVDIGMQVAKALAYAHERGIFHRDVKPQNLMYTADGIVKVLDFGLAKRIRPAGASPDEPTAWSLTSNLSVQIKGTLQYMSPEQLAGGQLDGRTDIFSLGVVLCELLTGTNPFRGQNPASTIGRIMDPRVPECCDDACVVSPALRETIHRCIQKSPSERYQSARKLLDDLKGVRRDSSPVPVQEQRPQPWARVCLGLLQFLYLTLYGLALVYPSWILGAAVGVFAEGDAVVWREGLWLATGFLASGCCGIAIRLYLLASIAFDEPNTGIQLRRLFPLVSLLDWVWAISPLVLWERWPGFVALAAVVLLAYLPISHLNLIRWAYPIRSPVFSSGSLRQRSA